MTFSFHEADRQKRATDYMHAVAMVMRIFLTSIFRGNSSQIEMQISIH